MPVGSVQPNTVPVLDVRQSLYEPKSEPVDGRHHGLAHQVWEPDLITGRRFVAGLGATSVPEGLAARAKPLPSEQPSAWLGYTGIDRPEKVAGRCAVLAWLPGGKHLQVVAFAQPVGHFAI